MAVPARSHVVVVALAVPFIHPCVVEIRVQADSDGARAEQHWVSKAQPASQPVCGSAFNAVDKPLLLCLQHY